jgi:hypothetical protein
MINSVQTSFEGQAVWQLKGNIVAAFVSVKIHKVLTKRIDTSLLK